MYEQIKYRAKCNGKWVYGYYVYLPLMPISKHRIYTTTKVGKARIAVIDPETLGRYTGLKDKNDIEIYEGDIADIRYEGGGHKLSDYTPCICSYGALDHANYDRTEDEDIYPCFYFEQHNGVNIFGINDDVEIIGDIHTNPELLK